MRRCAPLIALFVICWLAVPGTAFAQRTGARVSGFFGGSFGNGGSSLTEGASFGYRLTRHVGFEFDFGYLGSLDLGRQQVEPLILNGLVLGRPGHGVMPSPIPSIFPLPFQFSTSGHAITYMANAVVEFPTAVRWLRPYVVAGGGVGSLTEQTRIRFGGPLKGLSDSALAAQLTALGFAVPNVRDSRSSVTTTGLALTAGGGLDFQIIRHLAIGADVRWLRLQRQEDSLNTARVAARASVRF